MTGWVYVPAVLLIGLYGLSWLVLGLVLADEQAVEPGAVLAVLAWLASQVVFGIPLYYGLVEVAP